MARAWPLMLLLMLVAASGCVRRRLFVNSTPPGALVYVDNQQIGTTPCAVDFTYYGTREIRLVKPGFETLTVTQPIPTPWYQYPVLDFVSENLVPYKIRDNRTVSYNMSPQLVVPSDALIARGNELRQASLQGAVVPATAVGPPAVAVPSLPPTGTPLPSDGTNPTFGPPALGDGQPVMLPPPAVVPAPPGPLPPTVRPGSPSIRPEEVIAPPPATGLPQRGRTIVSPPLR